MNIELLGILAYLVLQFFIGGVAMRWVRSESDYFLAGRSLGLGLAVFSVFATWFGAETCIGSAGAVFQNGLSSSRADPFGYTLCLLAMGIFFAAKLRNRNFTTLADLFRERFSKGVEQLAVFLMVPTSLFWAAAQIRAFGQILAASSDMPVGLGISIAAGLVIGYTILGGLLADVVTDLVQGIALIAGLLLIFGIVIQHLGGLEAAFATIDPSKLSFKGGGESVWSRLDAWAIPILGSLVAQELISRILAARSTAVARRATIIAAFIYLTVGLIPVILGLLGPQLASTLKDPEQLLIYLAKTHLGTWAYILFAGALVSAILSTVDSTLLAASSLATHNLIFRFLKTKEEKAKVKVARIGVFCAGLAAYFLAIYGGGIYDLVEMASSIGSSGLVVITVMGLFTSFGDRLAAYAALVSGLIALPLGEYFLGISAPYLFSVAVASLFYATAAVTTVFLRNFATGSIIKTEE